MGAKIPKFFLDCGRPECFSSRINTPADRQNIPADAKKELPRPTEFPGPPIKGPVADPRGSTEFNTPNALLLKSLVTDCAVRMFPAHNHHPVKNPNAILNTDKAAMLNHAP